MQLFLFQEITFNAVASFSYLSSCSYLGFAVNTFLYPLYIITPFFQVYPAMTAAYVSKIINKKLHYAHPILSLIVDSWYDSRSCPWVRRL